MALSSLLIIMFFAQLSPGPDMALLLRNIVRYGRVASFFTVLGIAAGLAFHFSFASFGLAFLIKSSEVVFSIIKILGSLYLIYIGIMGFFEKNSGANSTDSLGVESIDHKTAFVQGLLCNLLNPKATLFIFSLYSGLITEGVGQWRLLSYSGVLLLEAVSVWSVFVYLATGEKVIRSLKKVEGIIGKLLSLILICLGIFSIISVLK